MNIKFKQALNISIEQKKNIIIQTKKYQVTVHIWGKNAV